MKLPTLPKNDILETASFSCSTLSRNSATEEVKLEKVSGMCRRTRRGAAVVEFAIIAPLFFMLVFGMIEFGRMIMVQQIITNASREGARVAVLDGSTTQDVLNKVNNYLSAGNISGATTNVFVSHNDGQTWVEAEPSTAGYNESVKVTNSVGYSQISWLPFSWFGNAGKTLQAATVMRRETVQ